MVDCLLDRGHPNKVSMKKEREKNSKGGGGQEVYIFLSGALMDDAKLREVLSGATIGCYYSSVLC